MAPNKRGGPISAAILSEDEVAARGRGTCEEEGSDSYDGSLAAEIRVFFTGALGARARCCCGFVCGLDGGPETSPRGDDIARARECTLATALPRSLIATARPSPSNAGVMFLTRLPVPAGTDHHPTYLMRSICYFPLIGAALVGPFGAAFFNAAAALWPRQAAAAAAVLATVWLTGCFHEDGLADCIGARTAADCVVCCWLVAGWWLAGGGMRAGCLQSTCAPLVSSFPP